MTRSAWKTSQKEPAMSDNTQEDPICLCGFRRIARVAIVAAGILLALSGFFGGLYYWSSSELERSHQRYERCITTSAASDGVIYTMEATSEEHEREEDRPRAPECESESE